MQQSTRRVTGTNALAAERVFPGESEMARLMRETDWSQTPLGPVESWSLSLRMMVSFLLANRFPLLLWWGPSCCQLYNDPYRPVLGTKHPKALGQPASECWAEIWDVIGPLIETPFNGGPATWSDDLFLEIHRHGFVEETHFTVAYSPVPDETAPNGIGGVLATVHEITEQVVAQRRVVVLRDLGARSAEAKSAEEACQTAAETLARHPKDLPFTLLYLIDSDGKRAHLAATTGVGHDSPLSARVIDLAIDLDATTGAESGEGQVWPLAEVVRTEVMRVVEDLDSRFESVPPGPWSDPPTTAVVLPIRSNIAHRLAGVLVAGVSSRLRLDDIYVGFYELISAQIATAIANARAYEEERRRAEALAAIDRAKTAFFSNVSHEFRTPLTLLLGPLEESLSDPNSPLPPRQRQRLELMRRNGVRLLKLVNTLLDFSRIEAGRVQASYAPTDLVAFTAELASSFRSLIEKAGLQLVVDCPAPDGALREPVFVDREMWEKIVLNLLSNAFKFTFGGSITVSLRYLPSPDGEGGGGAVELQVRDTGVGIPAAELPRLFERFHRVEGTRSRTHEGSGIGLALVQELVHLHGGTIRVESAQGVGTSFFVRLPIGAAHLPAERVRDNATPASIALGVAPYVSEAERWLPEGTAGPANAAGQTLPEAPERLPARTADAPRARILLADDNADMRDYLRRLLGERYAVEAVANGAQALAAIQRQPPDLVLCDVMMPELDGFGLLQALRADPRARAIPIILLSARAGEEATVEGLEAGADDYLVKPFSAREVVSRVAARLEIAQTRREVFERADELEAIFAAMTDGVVVYDREGRIVRANAAYQTIVAQAVGDGQPTGTLAERAVRTELYDANGRPLPREEWPRSRILNGEILAGPSAMEVSIGKQPDERMHFGVTGAPLRDAGGNIIGAVCIVRDITERRKLDRQVKESAERLRAILDLLPVGVSFVDASGKAVIVNQQVKAIWGETLPLAESRAGFSHYKAWWPDTGKPVAPDEWGLARALTTGVVSLREEVDIEAFDGTHKTILTSSAPLRDDSGRIVGGMSVIVDITERRRLERRTHEALAALLEMARVMVGQLPEPGAATDAAGTLDERAKGGPSGDTARSLVALCCRVLGCERVAFVLLDPATEMPRDALLLGASRAQEGAWRHRLAGLRLDDRFDAATCARLRAGEAVLIEVASLPVADPAPILSARYFLVAPMLVGGSLAGYLGVNFGDHPDDYPPRNVSLTQAVARLIGLVLERERLLVEREESRARVLALQDANARMDEFLSMASHELRTPLTSIMANVQLAARQVRSATQSAQRIAEGDHGADTREVMPQLGRADVVLERANRQLFRLDRLVGDLLDVSRIQAGKLDLRLAPCDLLHIVRDAVQEQQAVWTGRAISLDLPRRGALSVVADADRIGQVVTNLLTNALKYSPPERPVVVCVRARGDAARVEVRDQGPGLAPAQQARLFERFYRVPGIEQQSGSGIGLGLGLYISHEIMVRHGGAIGVDSRPSEGSTFWFTLPNGPNQAGQKPRSAHHAPSAAP